MNPEAEEFAEADALLQRRSDLPRLPTQVTATQILELLPRRWKARSRLVADPAAAQQAVVGGQALEMVSGAGGTSSVNSEAGGKEGKVAGEKGEGGRGEEAEGAGGRGGRRTSSSHSFESNEAAGAGAASNQDHDSSECGTDSSVVFWLGSELHILEDLDVGDDGFNLHVLSRAIGTGSECGGSGTKRWEGSLALGRWLAKRQADCSSDFRVLELGSGCAGIPGLVAHHILGCSQVVLTEAREQLLEDLRRNVALNQTREAACRSAEGCKREEGSLRNVEAIEVAFLDWEDPNSYEDWAGKVDLVLGSPRRRG